ncbi:MAG: hypothetical protein OSA04_00670 [Flavobacteriales bacterium]|nr:hypothetical protein [Flavobacteriales bacterium]
MKNIYPTHFKDILFATALFLFSFNGIQAQTFSVSAGPVSQVGTVSPESGASALGTGLSMQQSVGDFVSLDLDTWKGALFQDYGYQGEKAKLSSVGASVRILPFKSSTTAIRPWIGAGLSWGNTNVMADLYDQEGRQYHLWSDGLLYDAEEPQTSGPRATSANKATQLTRDYAYETSIANNRGLTIPVKLGVDIQLTPSINSSLSFTAQMGNSNVFNSFGSEKAIGGSALVTTVQAGVGIMLGKRVGRTKMKTVFSNNMFAGDIDFDKDGINDIVDRCHGTPFGAPVNEYGCALDTDGDGVADYEDLEIHSLTHYVDNDGIALSREAWDALYATTDADPNSYILDYAVIIAEFTPEHYKKMLDAAGNTAEKSEDEALKLLNESMVNAVLTYRVQYGVFSENQMPGNVALETISDDNGLLRFVGPTHKNTTEARTELEQSEALWADDAFITAYRNGKRIPMAEAIGLEAHRSFIAPTTDAPEASESVPNTEVSDAPVYRIQLGRFSDMIPVNIFEMFITLGDVKQVIEKDGTYRYFTTSYNNEAEARTRLDSVKDLGISDAFMTVEFKGEKMSILDAREIAQSSH